LEGFHCGGSVNEPGVCRIITWLDIVDPDEYEENEEDEEDEVAP